MWDSLSTINLVQDFWNLEQQLIYRPSDVYPTTKRFVQMSEVVSLSLNQDMQWGWKVCTSSRIETTSPQIIGGDDFSNQKNLNWLSAGSIGDISLVE